MEYNDILDSQRMDKIEPTWFDYLALTFTRCKLACIPCFKRCSGESWVPYTEIDDPRNAPMDTRTQYENEMHRRTCPMCRD
jgi:hypothetical protein